MPEQRSTSELEEENGLELILLGDEQLKTKQEQQHASFKQEASVEETRIVENSPTNENTTSNRSPSRGTSPNTERSPPCYSPGLAQRRTIMKISSNAVKGLPREGSIENHSDDDITVYSAPTEETKEVRNHQVLDALNERGLYTGSIKNYLPHGYGTMKYRQGQEYDGNWDQGHWHGHGTLKNRNGDVYEGKFVGDQKEGQRGTLKFSDGRIFKGRFQEDHMREGRLSFPDKGYYEGLFQGVKRNGFGLYVFADGSHYEGQWKNDQMHGRGRMEWTDGGWYNGDWYYGIQHGLGMETMPDGSIRHQGRWHKGHPGYEAEVVAQR
jgi:hypothetical protein